MRSQLNIVHCCIVGVLTLGFMTHVVTKVILYIAVL